VATRATIVRKCEKISKSHLHDLLMVHWSGLIAEHSKSAFAEYLDVSTTAIDKQLAGSMPDFATIMDAFDIDPTMFDGIMRLKGKKVVDAESNTEVADAILLIARLLDWLARAQHPNSPGGPRIVPIEIAQAEDVLRELHTVTGSWLDQLNGYRGLKVVSK
jgi:hypothetical protein